MWELIGVGDHFQCEDIITRKRVPITDVFHTKNDCKTKNEQTIEQTIELSVIWDDLTLISHPWNGKSELQLKSKNFWTFGTWKEFMRHTIGTKKT